MRVAKNARNNLIAENEARVGAGTAPSYFLECLLWNVPASCYRGGIEDAYRQAVDWLHNYSGPLTNMNFPNGMGELFGTTLDTSWSKSSARAIISAMYGQLNS